MNDEKPVQFTPQQQEWIDFCSWADVHEDPDAVLVRLSALVSTNPYAAMQVKEKVRHSHSSQGVAPNSFWSDNRLKVETWSSQTLRDYVFKDKHSR